MLFGAAIEGGDVTNSMGMPLTVDKISLSDVITFQQSINLEIFPALNISTCDLKYDNKVGRIVRKYNGFNFTLFSSRNWKAFSV